MHSFYSFDNVILIKVTLQTVRTRPTLTKSPRYLLVSKYGDPYFCFLKGPLPGWIPFNKGCPQRNGNRKTVLLWTPMKDVSPHLKDFFRDLKKKIKNCLFYTLYNNLKIIKRKQKNSLKL